MNTKEILMKSLEAFCTNTTGQCKNSFFENWFTQKGKTYNFIFKQNLFVTNIQFRELVDLIQLNVKKRENQESGENRPQINFMTTRDFIDFTANIIESFIKQDLLVKSRKNVRASDELKHNLEIICNNYLNLFENTIIIDAYYTSCIVSVPNSLELDIKRICFQSGYIHSCGENVYTRNIEKAKYDDFVERLKVSLKDYENPINFIMYTHEDFPIKNKLYLNDFQRHGLDEIKFYLEKFYMQDIPLMEVVEKLRTDERIKGKINIIKKSEARESNAKECIWMIIDRSIGIDLKYPGEIKYYICYKQIYINENPFHIFDEDKPGWINNVTIPHTLIGAMLNIGRGGCLNNNKEKYEIIDPFVGAGTTLLETLKYTDINFQGGDKCKISQLVAKINLKFFSIDIKILSKIKELIFQYIQNIDSEKHEEVLKDLEDEKKVNWNRVVVDIRSFLQGSQEKFKEKEEEFVNNFVELIEGLSAAIKRNPPKTEKSWLTDENVELVSQIWILLTWKTYKRNAFRYGDMDEFYLVEDSVSEFKGFLYRLVSYIHLRERSNVRRIDSGEKDIVMTYLGKYTAACSINSYFIEKNVDSNVERIQQNIDVRNFLKDFEENKVDLIVTDPPYGYNTAEEKTDFSKLYIEFINAMVRVMNNGGQIIMCLPSFSYSGKPVNIFAQKEMVSRQFMIAAQENNMYITEKKENLAEPTQLYTFPFYWDSEKALRRDIVRFQFFTKN